MAGEGNSTRQQTTHVRNQISLSLNSENEDKICSGTLVDLEALHCPFCCDALTSHIFQCDNGHLACSTCCNKLRNKCPFCALPIGYIRCRAMERIIEGVMIPCPNAKRGCIKTFPYGKESTHEKECAFSVCSCPAQNCNYRGSYIDVYSHFNIHNGERGRDYRFLFGESSLVYFELTEYTSVVMKERNNCLLFVVQCFSEPHGVYVTVSCISPSALEVGEFSCHIIPFVGNYHMTFELPKVKKIPILVSKTPEEDFMLVPSYLLGGCQSLKMEICIKKLKQK